MKHFIIVSCLFISVLAVSPEFKERALAGMIQIVENCIPQVGASNEDAKELLAKNVPSRKEGKCLLACISNTIGMMKDGRFSKEGILAALQPLKGDDPELYEKMAVVVGICYTAMEKNPETDECEVGFNSISCMHTKGQEMGIDENDFLI